MARTSALPAGMAGAEVPQREAPVFPLWLRISHWLNALGVIVMVTSGWRIFNASPLFDFTFPGAITLGGWLGGALKWHFAAMWIVFVNGLFYLTANALSRRLFTKFFPLSPRAVIKDFLAALQGELSHDDPRQYNAVQRAAYLFVMLDLLVLVLSGLAIWKPVQFGTLRELMGGYDFARRVHFFAMAGVVGFFVVHIVMVALVPRTLVTMIRGR